MSGKCFNRSSACILVMSNERMSLGHMDKRLEGGIFERKMSESALWGDCVVVFGSAFNYSSGGLHGILLQKQNKRMS